MAIVEISVGPIPKCFNNYVSPTVAIASINAGLCFAFLLIYETVFRLMRTHLFSNRMDNRRQPINTAQCLLDIYD